MFKATIITVILIFTLLMHKSYNNYSENFIKSVNRYNKYKGNMHFESIKNCKRYTRAIVVLLKDTEIKQFIFNNYDYLNNKFYDRLILFNTELNKKIRYANLTIELINVENLWKDYPNEFNFTVKNTIKKKRSEWGYQHMIRFYFKNIFTHKAMCNVKWYMRLDSDSIFNSSHNPFDMVNDSIVYIYNNFYPERSHDGIKLTTGLQVFLNDYIKYYSIVPKNLKNWKTMFTSTTTKTYYNNLEVVNMNFFISESIQQFINVIDNSHNIFYKCWGDAPLRYATLSLFAASEQVIPFKTKDLWYYWHDPY